MPFFVFPKKRFRGHYIDCVMESEVKGVMEVYKEDEVSVIRESKVSTWFQKQVLEVQLWFLAHSTLELLMML